MSLENLLSNKNVLEDLFINRNQNHNIYSDVFDGKKFSNFKNSTLVIILYYDDMEVVNPIGSARKKHKIGIFYWCLMNIKPEKRFRKDLIQLLALAPTKSIKDYGLNKLLNNLKLEQKFSFR